VLTRPAADFVQTYVPRNQALAHPPVKNPMGKPSGFWMFLDQLTAFRPLLSTPEEILFKTRIHRAARFKRSSAIVQSCNLYVSLNQQAFAHRTFGPHAPLIGQFPAGIRVRFT
jgi:hypothetical protein